MMLMRVMVGHIFWARLLWACLLLALALGGRALAADDNNPSASYRAFLQSLSASERKLPPALVAGARHAARQPLPAPLSAEAGQVARTISSLERVYRIDGSSAGEIVTALADLGVSPKFISHSRSYVTAQLTGSVAVTLSLSDAVLRITEVVGPMAQGQGSTQAAGAHRLADLYPADKPKIGDPALDGTGVVIGLISLPFKQADLDALEALSTRKIPDAAGLIVRSGDKAIAHGAGTLDAVDNVNGTTDILSLLQLIYDMAPGARVVLASPGVSSVPGELAAVVSALATGDTSAGIPAADIIIDDLFYPDQNPFEIDEVSEAITAASESGALYITAAGDAGQGGSSATSAVYVSNFEGIAAPAGLIAIDPFLSGYFVQSFGGDGFITLQEGIDRLCIFWSEKPAPGADPRFTAWVYDASNQLVVGAELFSAAPGGCTSVPIGAGHKVVFDQGVSAVDGLRLMVTGVRSNVPVTLAYSSAVFDQVTPGSIRGHAASKDAFTVAASDLCVDDNGSDYATCSARSISGYSSDGETAGTTRFFWESNGQGGYSAIANGLAVSKPDAAAAGQSILTTVSGGATAAGNFYGTSASAAVTAGIAALYWQHSEASPDVAADAVDETVRDLLVRAALDVGTPGVDTLSGAGILDAPKPFEDGSGDGGSPSVTVALSAKSAGAILQFTAVVGSSAVASYTATCTDGGAAIATWTDRAVVPATAYTVQAQGALVCTVTGSISDGAGGTVTVADAQAVTVGAVSPTAVFFDSSIDEASISWSTDPNIADPSMLTLALSCTNAATGVTVVDVANLGASPYEFPIAETDSFNCTVTTTLTINGGPATQVGAPATGNVTASPASGLPIWLLLQAIQQEEPAE